MLEQKHYAFDADVAEDAAGQASSVKIKTIRELTLTLLQEIESLRVGGPFDGSATINFAEEVRRFETELIRWALLRTGGHQRRAARLPPTPPTSSISIPPDGRQKARGKRQKSKVKT